MTEKPIDIDEDTVAQATQILDARTMKDAVNRALLEVVLLAERRAHADRLARMQGLDLEDDQIMATCGIIDVEVGFSAQTAAVHRDIRHERRSLPRARIDDDVLDRALEVQGFLADSGQHRLPIPEVVIAAAERAGLTVRHYDADFERIAKVTGQAHEWIVPRGTV